MVIGNTELVAGCRIQVAGDLIQENIAALKILRVKAT
jgi:hypothetical protein